MTRRPWLLLGAAILVLSIAGCAAGQSAVSALGALGALGLLLGGFLGVRSPADSLAGCGAANPMGDGDDWDAGPDADADADADTDADADADADTDSDSDSDSDSDTDTGSDCTQDADCDGFDVCVDCDDLDPSVNPAATVDDDQCAPHDGIDNDCDGAVDDVLEADCNPCWDCPDLDGDGVTNDLDCNDADAAVGAPATESCCPNGLDDDCDGETDEPSCCCDEGDGAGSK